MTAAGKDGALHEALDRDESVPGMTDRRFGLTLAAMFVLIGLASLWRQGEHAFFSLVPASSSPRLRCRQWSILSAKPGWGLPCF